MTMWTTTVQGGARRAGGRQQLVTTAGDKRKGGSNAGSTGSNAGSTGSSGNRGGDGETSSSPEQAPRRITGSLGGISMRRQRDIVRHYHTLAKVRACCGGVCWRVLWWWCRGERD